MPNILESTFWHIAKGQAPLRPPLPLPICARPSAEGVEEPRVEVAAQLVEPHRRLQLRRRHHKHGPGPRRPRRHPLRAQVHPIPPPDTQPRPQRVRQALLCAFLGVGAAEPSGGHRGNQEDGGWDEGAHDEGGCAHALAADRHAPRLAGGVEHAAGAGETGETAAPALAPRPGGHGMGVEQLAGQ